MANEYPSNPDRRTLDPAFRAEVCSLNREFVVRTGRRAVGPMHRNAAHTSAYVHNAMHGHLDGNLSFTDRREATS